MNQATQILLFSLLTSCCVGQAKNDAIALKNELHKIYRSDQQYREELSNMPPTSMKTIELWKKQNMLDSLNLIRVTRILDSMGFPHKPFFDDSACVATFVVIQHAKLAQQEKYLPLFQEAADQNELKPALVAMMTDRIRVSKGQKQIYGTQAGPVRDRKTGYLTDKYELAPIEDELNVNQRRLKVGLPTIEEGAKELGVDYIPKSSATVQPAFLFVSDIHLDNFKHQSDYNNDTGTDLWEKFLTKADSVLEETNSPAFILYTGDLPAHCGKNYLHPGPGRALHDSNMVTVLNGLRQLATRHNKPLFYLPGNNDAVAGDYYPFGYYNNYTPFSLIDETTNPYPALNINQGSSTPPCMISQPDTSMGYYSAYPVNGIRLIAMNTVIYTDDFFNNAKRAKLNPFTYADNQMRWLSQQLAQAKMSGEKVYIAMHVPPGVDLYSKSSTWTLQKGRSQKMSYTDQFLTLTNQYKDYLEVVLYGHTHMDELRLLNDSNNNVTGIAISSPGISPVHQNNPGFKRVTYDSVSKSLLDFTTYYTVLDNAFSYWGGRTYTFSSEFNKASGQTMYQQLAAMPLNTITSNLQKIYKVKHGTGSSNIRNAIEVTFTGQHK